MEINPGASAKAALAKQPVKPASEDVKATDKAKEAETAARSERAAAVLVETTQDSSLADKLDALRLSPVLGRVDADVADDDAQGLANLIAQSLRGRSEPVANANPDAVARI